MAGHGRQRVEVDMPREQPSELGGGRRRDRIVIRADGRHRDDVLQGARPQRPAVEQLLMRRRGAVVAPERVEKPPGALGVAAGQPVPGEQRADRAPGGPAEAHNLVSRARVLVAEEALEHAGCERGVASAALTGDRDPPVLAGRRHSSGAYPRRRAPRRRAGSSVGATSAPKCGPTMRFVRHVPGFARPPSHMAISSTASVDTSAGCPPSRETEQVRPSALRYVGAVASALRTARPDSPAWWPSRRTPPHHELHPVPSSEAGGAHARLGDPGGVRSFTTQRRVRRRPTAGATRPETR